MDHLQGMEHEALTNIRESVKNPHLQNLQLNDAQIDAIRENLNDFLLKFETLNFSGASKQIQYILDQPIHIVGFYENIKALRSMIQKELEEQLFMFIPKDDAEWYNKDDIFGMPVSKSFHSAKNDIKESCNCYSTGHYTASVFHLMRVLEHGLGALAKNVGLKFYRQSWGGIIKKIRIKLMKKLQHSTKCLKTLIELSDLSFYRKL